MYNQRRYRPLGVSDIFDEAFDLYKSNWLQFLGSAACVQVPLQVLSIVYFSQIIGQAGQIGPVLDSGFDDTMTMLNRSFVMFMSMAAVSAMLQSVFSGPTIYLIGQRYLDRPVGIGVAYLQGLRRSASLIAAVVMSSIAVYIGCAFCLIPGLYFACRWIATVPVIMLEPKTSALLAMRRSYALTNDDFWRCAGVLMLLGLLTAAITAAFQFSLSEVLGLLPLASLPGLGLAADNSMIASGIAGAFAGLLLMPFTLTTLTVLYYDMRIRQEGFDMAIIAEKLGLSMSPTSVALPHVAPPLAPKRRPPSRRKPGVAAQ